MAKQTHTRVHTHTATWVAVGISASLALAAGFVGYMANNPNGIICQTYPNFCASFTPFTREETTNRVNYGKTIEDTRPDLTITSMEHSNNSLEFTVVYSNQGAQDIPTDSDAILSFSGPDGLSTRLGVLDISDGAGYRVNESSTITIADPTKPLAPGTYSVCIDSEFIIDESVETNNCAELLVE